MQRIKKGDEVIVTAGKDKGRRGKVMSVQTNGRVVVEGVNMAKKHKRGNPNAGVEGGIVDITMPIHGSNVMLFNEASGKGERIGYKTLDNGKKVRYFRSNGESLD